MLPGPPLCFVERAPIPGSPAASAGLRAGDAILSFGDATNVQDIGQLLQPGQSIALRVMGRDGIMEERTVVPRPFDPKKPQSLLGCQITDICPNKYRPHPALRGVQSHEPGSSLDTAQREDAPEAQKHEIGSAGAAATYDARAVLRQQSYAWHDDADGSDGGYAFDDDDADLEYFHGEDGESEADDTNDAENGNEGVERNGRGKLGGTLGNVGGRCAPSDSSAHANGEEGHGASDGGEGAFSNCRKAFRGFQWRSRLVLLAASAFNLVHGGAFLAAPSFGSEAKAVVHAFRHDLIRLATSTCVSHAADASRRLVTNGVKFTLDAGGSNSSNHAHGSASGQLTLESFLRVALLVSCLEIALALIGATIALLPHDGILPRMRLCLTCIYPPTALVLWLLLAAGTVYSLTFRWEADELLRSYWQCLDVDMMLSNSTKTASSLRYFESVDVATAVCASANVSAIVGLLAACALTGWREVLRTSMMTFGVLSAFGGGLLASLGTVLLHSGDLLPPAAAGAMLIIGGSALLFGLLGIVAAKSEYLALLRLHAALLTASSVALAVLCAMLLVGGVESLQPLLHRMVHGLHSDDAHLTAERIGATGIVVDDLDVDEMVTLLQAHRLSVAVASVLGLFLLVMNGTMALGLQWLIRAQRHDLGDSGGQYAAIEICSVDPVHDATIPFRRVGAPALEVQGAAARFHVPSCEPVSGAISFGGRCVGGSK